MSSKRSFISNAVLLLTVAVIVVQPFAVAPVAAAPTGMVAVDDGNVSERGPAEMMLPVDVTRFEDGAVMTNAHPDTLEVGLTKSQYVDDVAGVSSASLGSDGLAIVLSDSIHHEGRKIAIDAGVLRDAIGYVPSVVYGTHESGEEWTRKIIIEDGYAVFRVAEFSSNVVTFEGGVRLNGTATGPSTLQYDLESLASASDFQVNFTGEISTETDTPATTTYQNRSIAINVAGNVEPIGPTAGNEPELDVSASNDTDISALFVSKYPGLADGAFYSARMAGQQSNGDRAGMELYAPEGTATFLVEYLRVEVNESQANVTIDVYAAPNETIDGDLTDGTKVLDDYRISNPGRGVLTIPFDSGVRFGHNNGTFGIVTESYSSGGTPGYVDINTTDSDASDHPESLAIGTSNFTSPTSKEQLARFELVSTPNDMTIETSNTKISKTIFANGGFASRNFEMDLSRFDDSATVNLSSGGEWTFQWEFDERLKTTDPSITVNGHTDGYTGTLNKGESRILTLNADWLQSSNSLTVEADPLSSDAPPPQVDYTITHDAQSEVETAYLGTSWTENYNISFTPATDRRQLNLTVPHKRTAVGISRIQKRVGSGSWTTVPDSEYSFNNTHLTVNFGDVSAGTTVQLRSNASSVVVESGNITVIDPSEPGEPLSSRFRVDDANGTVGLSIGINRSENPYRVHQTVSESWEASETFLVDATEGGTLELPNAATGDNATVETYPVRVRPETGEVRISNFGSSTSEPSFQVRPAGSPTDEVRYTFVDAADDTTYQLWSETFDAERDRATASSPVTLIDDDSDERLTIRALGGGGGGNAGGGGGADGGGGIIPGAGGEAPGTFDGLVVVAISLLMVIGIWVGGGLLNLGRDVRLGLSGLAVFYSIQLLNPSTLPSLLDSVNPIIPLVVIGGMVLLWRRFSGPEITVQAGAEQ